MRLFVASSFGELRFVAIKICSVGFGISNVSHVNELKKLANGIIIGSAIIKLIEEGLKNKGEMLKKIERFVRKIKKATFI